MRKAFWRTDIYSNVIHSGEPYSIIFNALESIKWPKLPPRKESDS